MAILIRLISHQTLTQPLLGKVFNLLFGINEFHAKVTVRHAIIVCAHAEAQCPKIHPFAAETLSWAFDDPAALEGSAEFGQAKFRRVRDEIDARIQAWLRAPERAGSVR